MATKTAKKKTPARKPARPASRSGGGSALAGWLKASAILAIGILAGYTWRSYYPLALPIESRLVSDATSADLGTAAALEEAAEARTRARRAEEKLRALEDRLAEAQADEEQAKRELGDAAIKNLLSGQ